MTDGADVVIAGMGPVGALLAALLGSRGVDTIVVEPQDGPYPKPRAAVLDSEALRGLGLVAGLAPFAAWATRVARSGVVGPGGRPLLMIEQTGRAYGFPALARIDQPALEGALRAAAAATGHVRVLTGRRVTAVEDGGGVAVADDGRPVTAVEAGSGVTVVLDDGRRVSGRWLVGCDGVGSDPDGLTIERATVFTFHARMADRWRAGRILLAGDAAHAMPPFAGAGLGMGIRDAVSLAWRLADAIGGDTGPLDGYEADRRPDVAKTTALSLRIGRVVQSRSRTVVRLIRGLLRTVAALPGVERAGGRPPLARRALPKPSKGCSTGSVIRAPCCSPATRPCPTGARPAGRRAPVSRSCSTATGRPTSRPWPPSRTRRGSGSCSASCTAPGQPPT
ncbi:FAD-dependent monooxygenase [Actinoplanes philippinensis]|uniref:FAD-dependent monooxygenase n=1 Tax=Actinoplanes philippinensis TaxID=35752 RepID=UPI0033D16D5C